MISGTSPNGELVEIIEIHDHPWFLGCQFHPEFKSRPLNPHPLFRDYIRACLEYKLRLPNPAGRFEKIAISRQLSAVSQNQVPRREHTHVGCALRTMLFPSLSLRMENPVAIADFWVGNGDLVMIAGPCVIESAELTLDIARTLKDYAAELTLPLIFKASYDKANRTSLTSFRGPGLKDGPGNPGPGERRSGAAGALRRPPGERRGPRRRGPGRLADPGLSLPPDRPGGGRGPRPARR